MNQEAINLRCEIKNIEDKKKQIQTQQISNTKKLKKTKKFRRCKNKRKY